MAVRHGYGKIAGTDALVFAYDTGDTRNSYKGEPTTNLTTDTPSQNGWQGTYSVVDSNTKTFLITTQQNSAAVGSAWRTFYWSVSSYIGSYITISADVEFVSETNCTFSSITIGQGNTGPYPYHIAGSDSADKVTISDKPVQKIHMTWSGVINSTGIVGFTQWIDNVTVNGANAVLRLTNVQIEAKSHETPFVNGTRSVTQGLLDLTGNSTIDISTVSFDSSAQKVFDGTSDYMSISAVGISDYSQPFTMECIFMVDPTATWDNGYRSNIFGNGSSYSGMYGLNKHGGDSVGLYVRDASGGSGCDIGGLSKGVYYHLVGTWDGTDDIRIYLNGSLGNTVTSAKSGARVTNIYIGGRRAFSGAYGEWYHGEIPVAKYYNRALTAIEVRNNFNLYKGRFNM